MIVCCCGPPKPAPVRLTVAPEIDFTGDTTLGMLDWLGEANIAVDCCCTIAWGLIELTPAMLVACIC